MRNVWRAYGSQSVVYVVFGKFMISNYIWSVRGEIYIAIPYLWGHFATPLAKYAHRKIYIGECYIRPHFATPLAKYAHCTICIGECYMRLHFATPQRKYVHFCK